MLHIVLGIIMMFAIGFWKYTYAHKRDEPLGIPPQAVGDCAGGEKRALLVEDNLLYRCDLVALQEKVFDLDIYRHGEEANKDGQGLRLRQLHKVEDPDSYDLISQPYAPHLVTTADGLQLRLRPEDTEPGLYSTAEWTTGVAEHFDQPALEKAGVAGAPNCFMVGRAISCYLRFSPNYASGTALGTAGINSQNWRGFEDPTIRPQYRDYTVLTIAYVGPQSGLLSKLASRSWTPRLSAFAMDFMTGVMWTKPIPKSIDISQWHTYRIEWHPCEIRYLVDDVLFATFKQGQRAVNLRVLKGEFELPIRKGFIPPAALHPGIWLDNNTAKKPAMDVPCGFEAEQWMELAWFEIQELGADRL